MAYGFNNDKSKAPIPTDVLADATLYFTTGEWAAAQVLTGITSEAIAEGSFLYFVIRFGTSIVDTLTIPVSANYDADFGVAKCVQGVRSTDTPVNIYYGLGAYRASSSDPYQYNANVWWDSFQSGDSASVSVYIIG